MNISLSISKKYGLHAIGNKVYKLTNCLKSTNDDELYQNLISNWSLDDIKKLLLNYNENDFKYNKIPEILDEFEERMQYIDILT